MRNWMDSIIALTDLLTLWAERSQQRRMLAGLDDAALRDIGLNRGAISSEIGKRFWQK